MHGCMRWILAHDFRRTRFCYYEVFKYRQEVVYHKIHTMYTPLDCIKGANIDYYKLKENVQSQLDITRAWAWFIWRNLVAYHLEEAGQLQTIKDIVSPYARQIVPSKTGAILLGIFYMIHASFIQLFATLSKRISEGLFELQVLQLLLFRLTPIGGFMLLFPRRISARR